MHLSRRANKKDANPGFVMNRTILSSAVHVDWHISKAVVGTQVCVVLDDASRKILSGGEFSNATAENSVLLLKEALESCRFTYNLGIRECISDHGVQFYGMCRDKHGHAGHAFENFLRAEGIMQLLCGVNHPQTNGKVEKWFGFYGHHRGRYGSFDELFVWYFYRMHGCLNMHFAETPFRAFIRKLPLECWMWQANKLLNGGFL